MNKIVRSTDGAEFWVYTDDNRLVDRFARHPEPRISRTRGWIILRRVLAWFSATAC